MLILHVSAECFPVAKVGGLGDVAGALPKYECAAGENAKLVMPMHRTKFLYNHDWVVDYKGSIIIAGKYLEYTIIKEKTPSLGFDLYLVDINQLLDREKVYGYEDDNYRYVAFQTAVVNWVRQWQTKPDIIHCHDYHTGLIPFMLKYCYEYNFMAQVPTVLTIHNAQYQGWIGWEHKNWLPPFDDWKGGMLEWKDCINALASGVKCAWKVNTVSPSYMAELRYNSNGLEKLFEYEKGKCIGILNGIDADFWNPKTDNMLPVNFAPTSVDKGKQSNKEYIENRFHLDPSLPLFAFIGRLVGEKAADILPETIRIAVETFSREASFIILGSGEKDTETQLLALSAKYPQFVHVEIGYNEALSHLLYAGADFLLMPSRVEPCGLNQMYAMKYGTIPMVRRTGGLQDTVTDIGDDGWGLCFNHATPHDVISSIARALQYYPDKKQLKKIRQKMMNIDHSWQNTVNQYIEMYKSC